MRLHRRLVPIALAALLLAPGLASAQFIIAPGLGGGFGGGYRFGGGGYFGSPLGAGYFGGTGYPFMYGGYPYGGYSYSYPSPTTGANIVIPMGFTSRLPTTNDGYAYTTPRLRPQLSPAIPYREDVGAGGGGASNIATANFVVDSNRSRIELRVPNAEAEVLFDGSLTKTTGQDRVFMTPPLEPNTVYTFQIEVRWRNADGKMQTVPRKLRVRAGETEKVDFTR